MVPNGIFTILFVTAVIGLALNEAAYMSEIVRADLLLKTTSLVDAIPLSIDLYGVSRGISAVTFTPVPLLIVASLWYLLFTSLLMVGQHFIEKRFSRGTGRVKSGKERTTAEPPAAGPAPAVPGAVMPGEPGAPLGNDFGGKG